MSQWSLRERLQPSLMDRLCDDHPDRTKESQREQSLDQADFKQIVVRDVAALLNCVAFEVMRDLEAYPHVQSSVLNFGVPDYSGQTAQGLNAEEIAAGIKKAIQSFEPRVIRNSLRVKARPSTDEMSINTLAFEIEATVFGQPAPFQITISSEFDPENGAFEMTKVSQ